MLKILYTVFFSFLLLSCGAPQVQSSRSIEQDTLLILRAESLIGTSLQLDDQDELLISRELLTPYNMGTLGSRNPENEDLESATFKIDPGSHQILVKRGNTVLISRELVFIQGQVRELRIRE